MRHIKELNKQEIKDLTKQAHKELQNPDIFETIRILKSFDLIDEQQASDIRKSLPSFISINENKIIAYYIKQLVDQWVKNVGEELRKFIK